MLAENGKVKARKSCIGMYLKEIKMDKIFSSKINSKIFDHDLTVACCGCCLSCKS